MLAAGVLLFIAVAGWMYANDRHYPPERKAGYTFSLLFILLAANILMSRISLLLAAEVSSIAAVALLFIGLVGEKWSKRRRELRLGQTPDAFSDYHGQRETGMLAALESLLAGDIKLVAVTLGLSSALVWAILLLRR